MCTGSLQLMHFFVLILILIFLIQTTHGTRLAGGGGGDKKINNTIQVFKNFSRVYSQNANQTS